MYHFLVDFIKFLTGVNSGDKIIKIEARIKALQNLGQ
jgi:hypothetical protein|tara:strand:- start:36 stop:146 length:111 start_codon:yes stop_codon:yes gene_type:complete